MTVTEAWFAGSTFGNNLESSVKSQLSSEFIDNLCATMATNSANSTFIKFPKEQGQKIVSQQ